MGVVRPPFSLNLSFADVLHPGEQVRPIEMGRRETLLVEKIWADDCPSFIAIRLKSIPWKLDFLAPTDDREVFSIVGDDWYAVTAPRAGSVVTR